MCDSSTDKNKPTGDNVGSDNSAGDAGKQTTQQGMLEKVYCNSSNISMIVVFGNETDWQED